MAIVGGAGERGGYFAFGGGFSALASFHVERGELDVKAGLVRFERDRAGESVDSAGGVVGVFQNAAEEGPCVAVVGLQLCGLLEFFDGVGEAALLHIDDAESVGRIGERGVELLGAFELGDGGGEVVFEF